MRRIIAWCVAGLPFAPRSQRAIRLTGEHEFPSVAIAPTTISA